MSIIKLYGYATSPFVRKTGCFLYYKGLEFEHVPVNPYEPEKTIGHTGGTQVPVLEIDGEWRLESSAHALWLDKLYPEKLLCPAEHRDEILEIDEWVSETFLHSIFRMDPDSELDLASLSVFWRLAAIVSAHTPMPEEIRHQWPDLVREAPFIRALNERLDQSESEEAMNMRIGGELVAHIGSGPYMGGLDNPSMLDLAIFPQLVFGYMFGLEQHLTAAMHPVLKEWMVRMTKHLPANPTLAADFMQVRSLKEGLA